jgi:hypothetical protein
MEEKKVKECEKERKKNKKIIVNLLTVSHT